MEQKMHTHSTQLSSYMSKLLRENFGKGPQAVYVSIEAPFITFYLRHFISPTEKVLLDQGKTDTFLLTRDLVMKTLIPEIKANIKITTGMAVSEFYYDWNLDNKSGILVAVCSNEADGKSPSAKDYAGKAEMHKEIIRVSQKVEKAPEEIFSFLLNERTLIFIRYGILVMIEKQLIRQGAQEQLRVAKRYLEKSFLHNNHQFEKLLQTKIDDIFVDWDFELDKSVIVFIMNPTE